MSMRVIASDRLICVRVSCRLSARSRRRDAGCHRRHVRCGAGRAREAPARARTFPARVRGGDLLGRRLLHHVRRAAADPGA
eukprot:1437261-Pleurochrysis_carterae.AAC.1